MTNERITELVELQLTSVDEMCIARGYPILSALVKTDIGETSPVTLASIKRYKLALPGESVEATVERLREAAFGFNYPKDFKTH